MPKSPTTAVPPLSLTIRLTIVSDGGASLLVIVHVTLSPRPKTTEPVCGLLLTAPALPTQLHVPSLYPVNVPSCRDLVPAVRFVSVVEVYFRVLAPSAAPAPKTSAPASVVMPNAPTTA